jgi:hypothetical protein
METKVSLSFSQESALVPILSQTNQSTPVYSFSLRSPVMLLSHLLLSLRSGLCSVEENIVVSRCTVHMCTGCVVYICVQVVLCTDCVVYICVQIVLCTYVYRLCCAHMCTGCVV